MPLSSLRLRALAALFFGLLLMLPGSVTAQEAEDEDKLEELKEEREKIQLEVAAAAAKVDASLATFDEVAQALQDINGLVDLHEARLLDAQQAVSAANRLVDQAEARRAEIDTEMAELRQDVADLALASFTGEVGENGEDLTSFLLSEDPTEAIRRRTLIEFQTGNLSDALDRLRDLDAEVEQVEADRIRAVEAAVRNQSQAITRKVELDKAKETQLTLVLDVEARLEARLAEASYLEEIDAEKAAEIRAQEEVIAQQIREAAAREAAAEAARRAAAQPAAPALPSSGDIVDAEGFAVHSSVQVQVTNMIQAARADGVTLTGYSWRSPERTAELRKINGCPDVHTSPPSSCRIPTARPGQSMHERGLAIDFQNCWRGSDCFTWLSANAATYGYFNLPSESWHWSTNGR